MAVVELVGLTKAYNQVVAVAQTNLKIAAVCMVSTPHAAMNRIEKSQQLKNIHKMYLQGVLRAYDMPY